jgi:hypothetical protein
MQHWHFFNAIWAWDFCIHCISKAVSEQVQYSGVKGTGNAVGSVECKVWGTYSSVADSSSHLENLLCWLLTVPNIFKNHSVFKFRIKQLRISWSCRYSMSEENWLCSWVHRGGLFDWNKPQVHSKKPTSIAALLPKQYQNSRISAGCMLTKNIHIWAKKTIHMFRLIKDA